MEQPPPTPSTPDPNERRLYPEDQARVDEFLQKGVNSVERRPFRPGLLLIILALVVIGIGQLRIWLGSLVEAP